MEEGSEIAEKRTDLQNERKKLEQANDIIINLQKDDQSEGSHIGDHATFDGSSEHGHRSASSHASTLYGDA